MRKNPFKENIQVIDEGYIGRHKEIMTLMSILRRNEKDSGYVISGLPRMGKTSLVKKCFAMSEEEGSLLSNNIITVCITVSTIGNFSFFLRKLTDELYDALEERELLDKCLEDLFKQAEEIIGEGGDDLIYEQDRNFGLILKKMKKKD